MSDVATMLRELSYPWGPGERMKNVIDRTSKMVRLSYWRTSDIWYRKARRIERHEVEQIAEALRIKNERTARNELHDLKLRILRLEASLATKDPDFHRPDIDHLRSLSNPRRGEDRAMARNVTPEVHIGFDPPD